MEKIVEKAAGRHFWFQRTRVGGNSASPAYNEYRPGSIIFEWASDPLLAHIGIVICLHSNGRVSGFLDPRFDRKVPPIAYKLRLGALADRIASGDMDPEPEIHHEEPRVATTCTFMLDKTLAEREAPESADDEVWSWLNERLGDFRKSKPSAGLVRVFSGGWSKETPFESRWAVMLSMTMKRTSTLASVFSDVAAHFGFERYYIERPDGNVAHVDLR